MALSLNQVQDMMKDCIRRFTENTMEVTIRTTERSSLMALSVREFVPSKQEILILPHVTKSTQYKMETHFGPPLGIAHDISQLELRKKCREYITSAIECGTEASRWSSLVAHEIYAAVD